MLLDMSVHPHNLKNSDLRILIASLFHRGANGTVYLATSKKNSGKDVAIKVSLD